VLLIALSTLGAGLELSSELLPDFTEEGAFMVSGADDNNVLFAKFE
jgi:hypothetical protein